MVCRQRWKKPTVGLAKSKTRTHRMKAIRIQQTTKRRCIQVSLLQMTCSYSRTVASVGAPGMLRLSVPKADTSQLVQRPVQGNHKIADSLKARVFGLTRQDPVDGPHRDPG